MPNRRQFLAGSLAMAACPSLPARDISYSEQMPDMLLTHLSGKLNALAAKWDAERAKIRTAADLEARNRFVREKFRQMIHGLPERNALNPVVTATHQREGYRIENVMFQSRLTSGSPAISTSDARRGTVPRGDFPVRPLRPGAHGSRVSVRLP